MDVGKIENGIFCRRMEIDTCTELCCAIFDGFTLEKTPGGAYWT